MIKHFIEIELQSVELFPPFNSKEGISTLKLKDDPLNTLAGQDRDTL